MPNLQTPAPLEVKAEEVERELLVWNAASRPFVQKSREFWIKVIAIASIFGFIIFIVEGAMPVILMIALIFLFYILSSVRPENIDYKITNLGVKIGDTTTHWGDIKRFWYSKRGNDEILVLDMTSFTGRLELVINTKDKDKIRQTLKKYIPEEEALQTGIDKASEWVGSKLS
jgi:hypothetical protein